MGEKKPQGVESLGLLCMGEFGVELFAVFFNEGFKFVGGKEVLSANESNGALTGNEEDNGRD